MRLHLALLATLLPACGTASFQLEAWPRGGPPEVAELSGNWEWEHIRAAHGAAARPAGLNEPLAFEIDVRDTWACTLLRWFTPLGRDDASFPAWVTIDPAAAVLRLDGRILDWSAEGATPVAKDRAAVYADSLYRYFLLPLLDFERVASLPAGSHGEQAYRRMWAQWGEDEFVLWSHPETGRVHFAEFTLRVVGDAYSGVLEFPSWADFPSTDGWETRLLPTEVVVRKRFGGGVVHRLAFAPVVPEAEFPGEPEALDGGASDPSDDPTTGP